MHALGIPHFAIMPTRQLYISISHVESFDFLRDAPPPSKLQNLGGDAHGVEHSDFNFASWSVADNDASLVVAIVNKVKTPKSKKMWFSPILCLISPETKVTGAGIATFFCLILRWFLKKSWGFHIGCYKHFFRRTHMPCPGWPLGLFWVYFFLFFVLVVIKIS